MSTSETCETAHTHLPPFLRFPAELEELREEVDFYQIATYKKALETKDFHFVSTGDANGYLYWLGTKQGKEAWTNPHNLLSVTALKGGFWCPSTSVTTRSGAPDSGQVGMCNTGQEGAGFSIRVQIRH